MQDGRLLKVLVSSFFYDQARTVGAAPLSISIFRSEANEI